VYRGEPSNIIGMLLVKKLIKIDPKDSIKIEAVELFRLPSVPADMPLYGLLKLFSRGGSTSIILSILL
jgi:metal transporter CNNM